MQGRLYLSFQDRFFNFLPVSMEMAKNEIFTIFSHIYIKLRLFSFFFFPFPFFSISRIR